jgi:hypothetical protein
VRRPIALVMALLLAGLISAPAEAATPLRTFKASFGTSGRAAFTLYTAGNGSMSWAVKGLKRSATYKAVVYRGKCGSLGTSVVTVGYITTTFKGALTAVKGVSTTKAQKIWQANWYKTLSLKITSGGSTRCGVLKFTRVTRVRMPAQGVLSTGINLPVVRGPSGYPYCNVGMYNGAYAQPREPLEWATFVYAHARKGMFYPLYTAWKAGRADKFVGKLFYLYTSNNKMHTYRITAWATGLSGQMRKVTSAGIDKAWLQTSTGPNSTYPKLFVKATWISTVPVSYSAAHPTPHIVKCG